jgi:trans-aconitate methyltransferase
MLQRYVHGEYKPQKTILLDEYNRHSDELLRKGGSHRSARTLELGCGDGNLAEVFPPQDYVGIDSSNERVLAARRMHPAYQFAVADIRHAEPEALLSGFNFVFCHAVLHHLDDTEVGRLLDWIDRSASKPATFIALEPVLPGFWRNPAGMILARMDDGRFVRTSQGWRNVLGDRLKSVIEIKSTWRWPVSGEAYVLRF